MKAEPVVLWQVEWILDGLSGLRFVRINGTTYTYDLLPGVVELIKPDGEVHQVTRLACSCNDARFRRRPCKHRTGLARLGLLQRAAQIEEPA